MQQLCLVTCELVACGQASDIAYHTQALAELYAAQPHTRVTVLFAGRTDAQVLVAARTALAAHHIELISLPDGHVPPYARPGMALEHVCSDALCSFLQGKNFHTIVFPDQMALAYVAVQAKRMGLAFCGTTLAVVLHAPYRWLRAGSVEGASEPIADMRMEFMQRYCMRHADVVLSPTRYMFDWAKRSGYEMAPQRAVCPYLLPPAWEAAAAQQPAPDAPDHLIYFGALAGRHGLHALLHAVAGMRRDVAPIRRLTFLTPDDFNQKIAADHTVGPLLQPLRLAGITLHAQRYSTLEQALQFVQQSGAVTVVPSLVDHCPYAVLGLLGQGHAALLSNNAGLAEIVAGEATFNPFDGKAFIDVLEARATRARARSCHYSAQAARSRWLAQLTAWAAQSPQPAFPAPALGEAWPSISVCVPYYNGGRYLPETLASLHACPYPDVEFIVVDDGSTEPASQQVFADMQKKYARPNWRFVRQDNQGVGFARNFAASHATGTLLLFFDADDIAVPSMLEDFGRGMQRSGADALSCYYAAFATAKRERGDHTFGYGYVPLGACWQAGMFENLFGGANFCVRRQVFTALGGFTGEKGGCEDWEFFAKLCLQHYRLEVVPKNLFLYRRSAGSMCTTMDHINSFSRAIRPYSFSRPEQVAAVLRHALIPMYDNHKHLRDVNETLKTMLRQTEARTQTFRDEITRLRAQVASLRRHAGAAAGAPAPPA